MYIGIHQLKVTCIIGILPREREVLQDIFIDLKVKVKDRSDWDQLEKTVCYVDLAALCTDFAIQNRYQLIEQLVEELLSEIMIRFPVCWAWIQIKKPLAIPAAEYAFVEMERHEK